MNVILTELMRRKDSVRMNTRSSRCRHGPSCGVDSRQLAGCSGAQWSGDRLCGETGISPVLARAAEVIELSTGGLGASVANLQIKREVFRRAIQATSECIRITATQKERVPAVLMKQLSLSQEDAASIYDAVHSGMGIGRQAHARRY